MPQEDTDKKFQINSSDDEGQKEIESLKSHVSSHQKSRMSNYNSVLDPNVINPRTKEQMIEELKNNGIIYNELRDLDGSLPCEMQISKINHTINYEIVILTVLIGPFEQNVTILNVFQQSFPQKIRLQPLFYQAHTNIYYFSHNQKQFICKSTSYSDNEKNDQMQIENRKQEILRGLKQFCISKIMSTLKIGPKIQRNCCFDMVVSESGVQFYLEPCIDHSQKGFNEHDEVIVKTNLKEMHILGFLHRDIKPGNMMYSKQYEKYVFIDFGISDFKRQIPGELIQSKFLGTYAYCNEDFKRLFKSRQIGMVDAHMNDAWGLSLSIKQMRKSTDPEIGITQRFANTCHQIVDLPDLLQRQIKRMIYDNQIEKISQVVNMKQTKENFQRKILNFFYEVPATESLRKFYLLDILDSIKMEKIFEELWECFKTPVFIESYKGTRKFLTLAEQKSNKLFSKIYTKIKDKYANITRNDQIYKRQARKLLFEQSLKQITKKLSLKEHQKLLVYFINFTSIKQRPSYLEKVKACEIYVRRVGLSVQDLDSNDHWMKRLIEAALQNVSSSILQRQSQFYDWDFVLKTIENYFIVVSKQQFSMNQFLISFVNRVMNDPHVSNLKKVQIMFNLLLIRRIPILRFKYALQFIQTINLEIQVEKYIKQILDQQQKPNRRDIKVFLFLLEAFNLFKNQSISSQSFDSFYDINQQIKKFRPWYPQLQKLLNLLQFQVGIQMQKNGMMIEGRKFQQENISRLKIGQGQVCFHYFIIINIYDTTLEIKKIKTHLALLDLAIDHPQISDEYFIRIRIIVQFYLKNQKRIKQLIKKYEIMSKDNSNLFYYIKSYCWIAKINELSKISYVKLIPEFQKLRKNIENLLLIEKDKYLKRQRPIVFKKSQNWCKLYLLFYSAKIQASNRIKSQSFQISLYDSGPPPEGLQLTLAWKQIISIDRSNFTALDHLFMMQFDIDLLRIQKDYDGMYQYVQDKIHLLDDIISKADKNEKYLLIVTFSTISNLLSSSTNPRLLQQFMKITINLLRNPRMQRLYLIQDWKCHLVNNLIQTNNFQFLMDSIIQSTKVHSRRLSNSNIPIVCRYYSNVASSVMFYWKEKQMADELRKKFNQISPKQSPIFSIFLLFFIIPGNRLKILKFLCQSLKYINHTGKQIILSRLYKEARYLPNVPSCKTKYFIRKGIIYTSRQKFTLLELYLGNKKKFNGIFLQSYQQKLIKLGQNCQNYDEVNSKHEICRAIFDQFELDSPSRQLQQWQKQAW